MRHYRHAGSPAQSILKISWNNLLEKLLTLSTIKSNGVQDLMDDLIPQFNTIKPYIDTLIEAADVYFFMSKRYLKFDE